MTLREMFEEIFPGKNTLQSLLRDLEIVHDEINNSEKHVIHHDERLNKNELYRKGYAKACDDIREYIAWLDRPGQGLK
jgi:hypothetical protein